MIKGRREAARSQLGQLEGDRLCVSAVTRAELLFGVVRLPPEHRLHLGIGRFLDIVPTLPWPQEAAHRYAIVRHGLERSGLPIGQLDMMIAAHALAIDAILVTNNVRHFERIGPTLRLRPWARS